MENKPPKTPEQPPLMSEDETDRVFKLLDQMSREQALRAVIGPERTRAVIASEQREKVVQSAEEARELHEERARDIDEQRNEQIMDALREPESAGGPEPTDEAPQPEKPLE